MFSFFRKKSFSKETKPPPIIQSQDQQQTIQPTEDVDVDRKLFDNSKKKLKSEPKKSSFKDKKVSFKADVEPVPTADGGHLKTPIAPARKVIAERLPNTADTITQESVMGLSSTVLAANTSPETDVLQSDSNSQLEEPPDIFCEAQEVILPDNDPLLPTAQTHSSETVPANITISGVESNLPKDLLTPSVGGDKQPPSHRAGYLVSREPTLGCGAGDVNPNESTVPDATCKPSFTVTKRDCPIPPSTAPLLPEEPSVRRKTLSIASTFAKMGDRTSEDGYDSDLLSVMEEQVRQLENELKEKNDKVEQLEAILADEERLAQLETLERLEADWTKERELADSEREEELRLLQEALEEALEEKAEIEAKMLRDASRESQLLDDFEWKLGEIERDYKKKLAETERATEERVKKEMEVEYQQLIEDKRDIDEKLAEIAHLKSYEAEVTQLRGLIHEQQRAIRVAARQVDQLARSEKLLQDDLNRIRMQGCTRKQQQEMEEKWEEKTMSECNRLRAELLATNEEEMLKAIRQVVQEKDEQIAAIKRQHESQITALNHQLTELKNAFQEREAKLNKQMESIRTAADRDVCDLRRQLNKVQDSHAEALEELQRKHAEEIERYGSFSNETKMTLEHTFEEKIQSIELQHQTQLNALQSLIEEEKQDALTQLGEHYQNQLQSLQEHIADIQTRLCDAGKLTSQKQDEIYRLQEVIEQQEKQIELLQIHSEEQSRSNKEISNGRRRSSDDSTTADSSSGEEGYEGSTPSNGRSAGDGCSPSASANASQDSLRPCPELDDGLSSIRPVLSNRRQSSSEVICLTKSIEKLEQVHSGFMCCEDPDHAEAQQIILEMHQVLADRDAELQRLTEEKRFYQLELIHWERNLALQRVGLPLALVPDRLSNDSDPTQWKGFSAPPVTKPRLPDGLQLSAAAAFGASRAASYELFSPSATSLSPDVHGGLHGGPQLFPGEQQHPSSLLAPADWPSTASEERPMHWQPQQGSHYYYSDDDEEDDDSNNNGFTTPL